MTPVSRVLMLSAALCALGSAMARAESMEETLNSALGYSPAIETAKAGKNIAHEDKVEQASNYYPQLSSYVAAGRVYGDNATSRGLSVTRGAGYSDLGEGSVTLRQMILTVSKPETVSMPRSCANCKPPPISLPSASKSP